MLLCLVICLTALIPGAPSALAEDGNRTVEIEIGETELVEDGPTRGLSSYVPDLSLRPGSSLHYVDKVQNMYGVGLNGVDHTDTPYIPSEQYPYTLVGNGLCSRIMVMMDAPIPKSVHPGYDLTDPEVRKCRSVDLAGQYKLKDQYGDVYYTYCCDVATDANLHDTYDGRNLEEADHFNEQDPSLMTLANWQRFCFGMLDLAKRQGWK